VQILCKVLWPAFASARPAESGERQLALWRMSGKRDSFPPSQQEDPTQTFFAAPRFFPLLTTKIFGFLEHLTRENTALDLQSHFQAVFSKNPLNYR
jgi:hypothetical protein